MTLQCEKRLLIRSMSALRPDWRALTQCVALTISLSFFLAGTSRANDSLPELSGPSVSELNEDSVGFRNGDFIVVPIPGSNPTFGTSLTLGAGYLFKSDAASNTSVVGIGGFATSNGTKGYAIGTNLAFDENRWLASFAAGELEAVYDLFLFGSAIPLTQEGQLIDGKLSYGVTQNLSFGVSGRYLDTKITSAAGIAIPPVIADDLGLSIMTLGLIADWDRRDSDTYSTSGTNLSTAVSRSSVSGSSRRYQKATLTFDGYLPISGTLSGAARAAVCGVTDDVPFFDACSLGGTDNFRGFSFTENIGQRLISAQVALRGRIGDQFGYAFFAGAGEVFDTIDGSPSSGVRYAGGLGGRYRVSDKFPVDLAVDLSVNDAGKENVYIYVGQRF